MIRSNQNNISRAISNDQIIAYNISQRARASASGLALPNESTPQDSFNSITKIANELTESIKSKEPVISQTTDNNGKHGGLLGWMNNSLDNIFGHSNLKKMDAGINGVIDGVGNALGDFKNYAILAAAILLIILLLKK